MKYKTEVYKTLYESDPRFDDRDEARMWGAARRKDLAEQLGVDIFDLWFEVIEVEEEEE